MEGINYIITMAMTHVQRAPMSRVVYGTEEGTKWGFLHPVEATQMDARRLGASFIVRIKLKGR